MGCSPIIWLIIYSWLMTKRQLPNKKWVFFVHRFVSGCGTFFCSGWRNSAAASSAHLRQRLSRPSSAARRCGSSSRKKKNVDIPTLAYNIIQLKLISKISWNVRCTSHVFSSSVPALKLFSDEHRWPTLCWHCGTYLYTKKCCSLTARICQQHHQCGKPNLKQPFLGSWWTRMIRALYILSTRQGCSEPIGFTALHAVQNVAAQFSRRPWSAQGRPLLFCTQHASWSAGWWLV